MTAEEVRARRDKVWEVARRHGVERLTVVVAEPGRPLPYDYDVYFEAKFSPELKGTGAALDYASAIEDTSSELSDLLGCRAWVGDLEGTSVSEDFTQYLRARATAL